MPSAGPSDSKYEENGKKIVKFSVLYDFSQISVGRSADLNLSN